MALVVNHNIPALQAYNAVNTTSTALERSIQKLSTGLRINSAADDAAGLAISEKMRAQIRGLDRAVMNSQDGISMIQTAEGALVETQSILQRMRELSIQAANDTLTQQDRGYIQLEIDQLREEVSRIGNTTQFNKKKLLDGSAAALWSSDRQTTKAIINGGLRVVDQFGQKSSAEGNYVLDINASAGKGQVQKSDVFTIKHKDVIMRLNANTQAGINGVRVSDIPAGEYTVKVGEAYDAAPAGLVNLRNALDLNIQNFTTAAASFRLEIDDVGDIDVANGTITFTIRGLTADDETTTGMTNEDKITIASALHGGRYAPGNSQVLGTGNSASVFLTNGNGTGNAFMNLTQAQLQSMVDTFDVNQARYNIDIELGAVQVGPAPGTWSRTDANAGISMSTLALSFASNAGINEVEFDLTYDTVAARWVVSALDLNGAGAGAETYGVDANGQFFLANGERFQLTGLTVPAAADQELSVRFEFGESSEARIGVTGAGTVAGDILIRVVDPDNATVPTITFNVNVREVAAGGATIDVQLTINGVYQTSVVNWDVTGGNTIATFTAGGYEFEMDFSELTAQVTGWDAAASAATILRNTTTGEGALAGATAGSATLTGVDPEPLQGTDNARQVGHYGTGAANGIILNASEADKNASILLEVVEVDTLSKSVIFKATANILNKNGNTDTKVTNITLNEDGELNFGNLGITLSAMLVGGTFGNDPITNKVTSTLKIGDKMAYNIVPNQFSAANDRVVEIDGIQNQAWNESWGASVSTTALRYTVNVDAVSGQEIHLRNFYINEKDGTVYSGNVVLDLDTEKFSRNNLAEGTSLATFEAAYIGQVAQEDVKLRDLDKFWNSEGRFLLKDAQTLTITQGDGTRTKVTLYATDTLKDVASKLNQAVSQQLGQSRLLGRDSAATKASDNFVTFVNEKGQRSESVAGTFVIRSIIAGSNGELNFAGDQELLNALSLNEIQAAEENSFTVSVWEAHFGRPVDGASNIKISGNKLIGAVHPNVDVIFDPMANINVKWNEATKSFTLFKDPTGSFQTVVHLADATTVFQIGANEGEDMGINIGDMRAEALGLNGVLVTDREAAARSITIIDNALDRVSSQRANLGAYQNRLEHTINNLTVASQNLTASESRIRDTDMAKEMMNFTKLQIMLQAGTNMLAQANGLPQNVLGLIR